MTGGYGLFTAFNGYTPGWTSGNKGIGVHNTQGAATPQGYVACAATDPLVMPDSFHPAQLTLLGYGAMAYGNDCRIVVRCATGASGSSDHDWGLSEVSDGHVRLRLRNVGGLTAEVSSVGSVPEGTVGLWGGIYNGTTLRTWLGDHLDVSSTNKSGLVEATAGRVVSMVNRISDGAAAWTKPLYWVAILDVALTTSQLQQLSADPFGPFRPAHRVWALKPYEGTIWQAAWEEGVEASDELAYTYTPGGGPGPTGKVKLTWGPNHA
jgi:hypothetical protein